MNKADMKLLRGVRRDRLVSAGALVDAYRSTTTRSIPSGKVYRRKPKHNLRQGDQT